MVGLLLGLIFSSILIVRHLVPPQIKREKQATHIPQAQVKLLSVFMLGMQEEQRCKRCNQLLEVQAKVEVALKYGESRA